MSTSVETALDITHDHAPETKRRAALTVARNVGNAGEALAVLEMLGIVEVAPDPVSESVPAFPERARSAAHCTCCCKPMAAAGKPIPEGWVRQMVRDTCTRCYRRGRSRRRG